MRKYYEAYDDRYRQVHKENLHWFDEKPSGIVFETMEKHSITTGSKIMEIGCGEGRDARFLLTRGYDVLATDISQAAISYCQQRDQEHMERYACLDCLKDQLKERFDFIYAVSVIHMLVLQEDRDRFYEFFRNHLKPDGIGLICSMGDGIVERSSDITNAFETQERIHEPSGKILQLASTSYRAVSFESFRREMESNGLEILEMGLTDIQPDYWKIMFAVVKAKCQLCRRNISGTIWFSGVAQGEKEWYNDTIDELRREVNEKASEIPAGLWQGMCSGPPVQTAGGQF